MREIHTYDSAGGELKSDQNRIISRRSPIKQSESNLVSRDYQPRMGGPELVASWPLGSPPSQIEPGDVDWEITQTEYAPLQKNILSAPYLADGNFSPTYLILCGSGYVESSGTTLSIRLTNPNLKGKPYETEIHLENTDPQPFMSPLVEFTPDRPDYENMGRMYPKYVVSAKISGGTGFVDQGTNVQLWSE